MATWTGVITNAGNDLLNKWVEEKSLHFEYAKAGTGTVAVVSIMAQTDMVNPKQNASILSAESVTGGIRLKLRITAPQESYLLNQFGVWASVDGSTALIAIYQHEIGVSIPSISESPDFVFTFYALIMTSNTGNWAVTVDTTALVNVADMNAAIATAVSNYLPKSGGTMIGQLNMGGNKISSLGAPTEETDAATKGYVDQVKNTADNALPKSGGTMTGAISMGGNKIKGMSTPEETTDAATKGYVDGKLIILHGISVPASAFAASADQQAAGYGYRAAIPLAGMTAEYVPDVYFGGNDAVSGNFSPVAQSYEGGIYIYAASPPNAAVNIPTIVVMR